MIPTADTDTDIIIIEAASRCLSHLIPFAVCHLPGAGNLEFFCGILPVDKRESYAGLSFEIGPWLAPWSERITLGQQQTPFDILSSVESGQPKTEPFIPNRQISKEEYLMAVASITDHCRNRDGKTVYSRVISGCNPDLNIAEAARRLFAQFPDSFGFLYYTPQTGCWLGATPETLLDYEYSTRMLSTMAFAGTRKIAKRNTPWDDKNLRENQFVADYISERMAQTGIIPSISIPYTVNYGVIQHLRRDIIATLPGNVRFWAVLDLINPTPALCGYPLKDAIEDINRHELHTRGCYGGFLGVLQSVDRYQEQHVSSFRSFVNLRSARLSLAGDGMFELFVGGGILSGSDPQSEWDETRAKAARLMAILLQGE